MGLAVTNELIEGEPDVLCNLTEQDGRNIAALMKRDGSASATCVSKLLVRTALANFGETKCNKNGDDRTRFESGDVPHRSNDHDILHADKLGLQVRLAVFKKHGDNFLQVMVHLVESHALRVRARKARDKPHKEFGLWATFNDGRVGSHD